MDLKAFIDKTGIVIIAICIVALLGAFAYSCFLFSKKGVQQVTVEFVMPVDSTGVIAAESIQTAESLKSEMIRHEQLLEDRYKHILEQKENMNDLLSVGGMFLAVVLALFGFFGYRSISSIEERVKLYAESKALETTRDKLKTLQEDAVESVTVAVKESFKKDFANYKESTKKQLESRVKEDVKDITSHLGDISSAIEGQSASLNNLSQKHSELNDRVLMLESKFGEQERKRRTFKEGGKTE